MFSDSSYHAPSNALNPHFNFRKCKKAFIQIALMMRAGGINQQTANQSFFRNITKGIKISAKSTDGKFLYFTQFWLQKY